LYITGGGNAIAGFCAAEQAYTGDMQRKIFWMVFAALGLVTDLILPLWWAVGATIPLLALSWWIAYRSEWFE